MAANPYQIYEFGPFRLDLTDRLLTRKGKPISLTPKAFEVLACLVEKRGHLVEKGELMSEVWADAIVEEGNLSRTIWMLRQALRDDRNGHGLIETVPKHGYRFVADVRVTERRPPIPDRIDSNIETIDALPESVQERTLLEPDFPTTVSQAEGSAASPWNRRRLGVVIAAIGIIVMFAAGLALLPRVRGIQSVRSIKPEAMDAYMDGVNSFNSARNLSAGPRKDLFLKAIDSLDLAVSIEPDFIDAQSKLVQSYVYLAMITGTPEYWAKLEEVGNRTLQLDPSNAAAMTALGVLDHRYNWNWAKAEQEYKQAIEFGPHSADSGHANYALLLSGQGRHDEAIVMMKRAIEIDPNSDTMKVNLGNIYIRAKQYDKAFDQLNKVAEWHPASSNLHSNLGQLLAIRGDYTEAIAETKKGIELSQGGFWQEPRLAWVYAKAGDRNEANKLLDEFMKKNSDGKMSRAMFDAAGAYAELGENDKAYALLEKLYAARSMYLIWLKVEPTYERLHGDRRYEDLVRRIGQ